MKKTLLIMTCILVLTTITPKLKAQEWSTSLDIYSSYIWRGAKFGTGPAFQPGIEFSTGGFAIGGWGSVNAGKDEALEMDLYASYTIGGFSVGITDYYFGGDWTNFNTTHYIEPSLSFGIGDFSIGAYYMLLAGSDAVTGMPSAPGRIDPETGVIIPPIEGVEGAEAVNFGASGDIYFEAAYSFASVDLTLGAGDGQYTSDGNFNICNIGIGTSKELKLTESFSLPISGAVILNPSTGGFFIVAGISL